ncbi:MAG: cyclic nucleotide-binding domain-containing protein [SAR324 cluster bacterium]|nr:cyclic nucleotide-binding domain-containing protein [SAR324 cluster bacterium]
MTRQELYTSLRNTRYFINFSEEDLLFLMELLELRSFPPNHVVLQQGQINQDIFFILEGHVVLKTDQETICQFTRRGDMFGEMSALTARPSEVTIESIGALEVAVIPAKASAFVTRNPQHSFYPLFYQWLFQIIADKLHLISQKAKQFEETNRLKDDFLAIATHDLRAPVSSIITILEVILTNYDLESHVQEMLTSCMEICNDQLSLINNFLDIAKIESGQLELEYKALSPAELLGQIKQGMNHHRVLANNKNISLQIELHNPVNDSDHLFFQTNENQIKIKQVSVFTANFPIVSLDISKVRQVLNNLVSNAIKFTPEHGQITLKISHPNPEIVQFSVQDSGMGISPENIKLIFDKYKQVKNKNVGTKGERGTGLGLAICKNMVELHHGTIWVESKPGHGSVFHFTLPMRKQKTDAVSDTTSSISTPLPNVVSEPIEQPENKSSGDQQKQIWKLLSTSSFFKDFTDEDLSLLLPLSQLRQFEKEDILIHQGDTTDNRIFFLLKGQVSVYVDKRFILMLNQTWDIFGEMAICSAAPRSASVIADSSVQALILDASIVHDPSQQHNYQFRYYFYNMLAAIMSRKLKTTSDRAKLYEDALTQNQQMSEYSHGLEKRLQDNLEHMLLYTHMINSVQEGIFIMTPTGKITMTNPAIQTLFFMRDTEIIGRDLVDFVTEEDSQNRLENQFIPNNDHKSWLGEVLCHNDSGHAFPAYLSMSPVRNPQNEILALSCIIRDITRQKEQATRIMEQTNSLEQAYAELQELDKLKDNFLTLMSHEMRTPLSTVMACAEMLNTPGMVAPEDQPALLGPLLSETQKLDKLIGRVIYFSNLEQGTHEFQFMPGNIYELMQRLHTRWNPVALEKGLEMGLECSRSLRHIQMDIESMDIVLDAILENAVMFTDSGFIEIKVTQNQTGTIISIRDTGIGIAPENIPKVFKKFETFTDMTYHQHGMGLGMPVSKLIISAHHGEIWLESTVKEGSTFFVSLPRSHD